MLRMQRRFFVQEEKKNRVKPFGVVWEVTDLNRMKEIQRNFIFFKVCEKQAEFVTDGAQNNLTDLNLISV